MSKRRVNVDRDAHEEGEFVPAYIPKFTTPEDFINKKVEILREQFKIKVSDEDIQHLLEFKTENDINIAIKGIINKYWE